MKSTLKFTFLLMASLLFTACDSDSKSGKAATAGRVGITAEGYCTAATVVAFNTVNNYNLYRNQSDAAAVVQSCGEFQALVGTRSCIAKNTTTDLSMTISYTDVQSTCEQAARIIRNTNPGETEPWPTPTPEVNPTPTPAENSSYRNFTMTIRDEVLINKLLQGSRNVFIQRGRFVASIQDIDRTAVFCSLSTTSRSYEVRQYDKLIFTYERRQDTVFAAVAGRSNSVSLGCGRVVRGTGRDAMIEVYDLHEVFGSAVSISEL